MTSTQLSRRQSLGDTAIKFNLPSSPLARDRAKSSTASHGQFGSDLQATFLSALSQIRGDVSQVLRETALLRQEVVALHESNSRWETESGLTLDEIRNAIRESEIRKGKSHTLIINEIKEAIQSLAHTEESRTYGAVHKQRDEVEMTRIMEDVVSRVEQRQAKIVLTPVLEAIEKSKVELRDKLKLRENHQTEKDHAFILETIEKSRTQMDFSPVMAAIEQNRAQLDISPMIKAIERNRTQMDFSPVMAAIERIKTQLDLSPVIAAIERNRTQMDFSPVLATIERNKNELQGILVRGENYQAKRDSSLVLEAIERSRTQLLAAIERSTTVVETAIAQHTPYVDFSPIVASIDSNSSRRSNELQSLANKVDMQRIDLMPILTEIRKIGSRSTDFAPVIREIHAVLEAIKVVRVDVDFGPVIKAIRSSGPLKEMCRTDLPVHVSQ